MLVLWCMVVLCLRTVVCQDDCVSYSFEEDFYSLFNNEEGACVGLQFWVEHDYETSPIESPNELSERFISPLPMLSCVSSFPFTMTAGGTVETLVYMDSVDPLDQITVLANQIVLNDFDAVVGTLLHHPNDPNFVNSWQTLRITLIGTGTFQGYVSFMGMAAEGSVVLVDSFRYIPPTFDDEECPIYEEDLPETEPTTVTGTEPTTPTTITETQPTTITTVIETETTTQTTITVMEPTTPTTVTVTEPTTPTTVTETEPTTPTTVTETVPTNLTTVTETEPTSLTTITETEPTTFTETETTTPTVVIVTEPTTPATVTEMVPTLPTTIIETEPTTITETQPTTMTTFTKTEPTTMTTISEKEPTTMTSLTETEPTTMTTLTETHPITMTTITETVTTTATITETEPATSTTITSDPTTETTIIETESTTSTTDAETDQITVTETVPTTVTELQPTTQTTVTATETITFTTVIETEPTTDTSTTIVTEDDESTDSGPTSSPTTESNDIISDVDYNFWTPLTISMVVILCVLALVVIAVICYYLGWKRANEEDEEILDLDLNGLPKGITLPRVKKVYPDINTNPYMRNP